MHSHVREQMAGETPVFVMSCVAWVQANRLLRLVTAVPFFLFFFQVDSCAVFFFKLTVVPFFQVDSCAIFSS